MKYNEYHFSTLLYLRHILSQIITSYCTSFILANLILPLQLEVGTDQISVFNWGTCLSKAECVAIHLKHFFSQFISNRSYFYNLTHVDF